MASTMATMAVINTKCLGLNTPRTTTTSTSPSKHISKPITLPKGLITPKLFTSPIPSPSPLMTSTALAGVIFSTLGSVDPAFAAQQIADIAEGDNRGLALLLPIIPAIGWVLFNILQPALNQLNRMRSQRGVVIGLGGLGLSGLVGNGLLSPEVSASEIAKVAAETGGSDNRGQLLLLVVLPAIGWVLYNILQPALNQLNRMRSQ